MGLEDPPPGVFTCLWQVGAVCWLGTQLGPRPRGLSLPPHGLLQLPLRELLAVSPSTMAGLQELESQENRVAIVLSLWSAVEVPEHHLNCILLVS